MSKEELLKCLIAEIDLIMHDKDYRFENEDGTWYSRESCKNLTNEEVFEEIKGELMQLSDLETKLEESEERYKKAYREGLLQKQYDKDAEIMQLKQQLAESEKKNFELIAKLNLKEHRPAFCTLADRECEALGEVEELKQQLAEKEKEIEDLNYRLDLKFVNYTNSESIKFLEDQDKISFALEQLEKVKEFALELFRQFCQSLEYHSNRSLVGRRFIEYYPLNEYIDNQIKKLKEGK